MKEQHKVTSAIWRHLKSYKREMVSASEYNALIDDYNELVDKYNDLASETALESCFLQGISESEGIDPNHRTVRGFNISIYLSEGRKKDDAIKAIDQIVDLLGYEKAYEKDVIGSFWRRLTTASRALLGREDVQNDLKKAKRHLEQSTVTKSQAEIDEKLAIAVAQLLQAAEDEEAIFMFQSFVIVKALSKDGKYKTITKTLTADEQLMIATQQSMLQSPCDFFAVLQSSLEEYKGLPSDNQLTGTDNE